MIFALFLSKEGAQDSEFGGLEMSLEFACALFKLVL
jgi:hypothetical protein